MRIPPGADRARARSAPTGTSCELGRRGESPYWHPVPRRRKAARRAAASIDDDQDLSRPATASDENVRTVASEHRDARRRESGPGRVGPDPGFDERARTQAAMEQSP